MKPKRKKIIAAVVAGLALLSLLVIVLQGSPANYWITPAELKARGVNWSGQARVAGQVVSNSMDWDRENKRMVFKIQAQGEKEVLPVVFQGFVPDGFINQSQVIAEGSMSGENFIARNLLMRCPDNYLPEKAVGSLFKALRIEGQLYQ